MHVNYPGTTLRRGFAFLSAVAVAASLVFTASAPAQAQTQAQATPQCTLDNWKGTGAGKANITAGTQGPDNRRYGGPCGMRVTLSGSPSYVADNSPSADDNYIVRFYTFLRNATGSEDITIFDAVDGTQDDASVVKVTYNPAAKKLAVVTPGHTLIPETFMDIDVDFWNSIEIVRTPTEVIVKVNDEQDISGTYASSPLAITEARLGNVSGAGGGGSIDFDDFDSRRDSRPGELLRADANGDEFIDTRDVSAVLAEINDIRFALGQPDCNEDGSIDTRDIGCLLKLINR